MSRVERDPERGRAVVAGLKAETLRLIALLARQQITPAAAISLGLARGVRKLILPANHVFLAPDEFAYPTSRT
jgi:hypothetical protein